MIPLAWLLVAPLNLPGAGVAAVIASIIAFFVYVTRVRRSHGARVNAQNMLFVGLVTPFFVLLALAFEVHPPVAYVLGVLGVAALCWNSFKTLRTVLAR